METCSNIFQELIQLILREPLTKNSSKFLEIGCGSGAISLSLLSKLGKVFLCVLQNLMYHKTFSESSCSFRLQCQCMWSNFTQCQTGGSGKEDMCSTWEVGNWLVFTPSVSYKRNRKINHIPEPFQLINFIMKNLTSSLAIHPTFHHR
jgi:hypothetical protein